MSRLRAARSSRDLACRNAASAPSPSARRAFLIAVRSRERAALFRCSRILLVRIRFSADLTFGKTGLRWNERVIVNLLTQALRIDVERRDVNALPPSGVHARSRGG